jgi:hypothetical protein
VKTQLFLATPLRGAPPEEIESVALRKNNKTRLTLIFTMPDRKIIKLDITKTRLITSSSFYSCAAGSLFELKKNHGV